jgi:hypothetical protein
MSIGVAAVLVSGSAFAQPAAPVARLAGVEGNVLVSQGDGMAAASNGQVLPVGTRVLTTAGAKVTISFDGGCQVPLKENQRFTVRTGECAALLAEVVPLGPAAGAIGGGTVAAPTTVAGLSTTGVVVAVGTGLALGYGAYKTFKSQNVSPN